MKLGLFIGRMNPPHYGHLKIITQACQENDSVLVLLGTPKHTDVKNPLSFEERKMLLESIFPETITTQELPDHPSDEAWVASIFQKIKQFSNISLITFYGGDFSNDSAYQVFSSYEKQYDYDIVYKEVSRKESRVEVAGEELALSGTNFRKMLQEHPRLAKKFTDEKIFQQLQTMLDRHEDESFSGFGKKK